MVKSETMLLREKIRDACEILRTESPSEVAQAILQGLNPPNISYPALQDRIRRLLAKRVNGEWVLDDDARCGRPRTVFTPKGLGRIKKMRKKSCRKIESYIVGSPATTISKSSAHRGKCEVRFRFFKYLFFTTHSHVRLSF